MTSCTILISHYESLPFLHACIRQIIKHSHNEIETQIVVIDQSSSEYNFKMCNDLLLEFDGYGILVAHTEPLWSGFGIDWAMRNLDIKTDYIVQLHTDAFPIHKNWLYLPIKLIEENNFSFVGQLHFINEGNSPTYPPQPFFSMSPTFNVARTETYKEMALEAGFTRFHNRPQSGLKFKNEDWSIWASEDYKARGSDDDVVAFCWESRYRNTNKLGLAISSFIESSYGRIIDEIVFHFGSCNEAKGVMEHMPEKYREFTKRINEDYSETLIDEMIALSKENKPPELEILSRNFLDGTLKKHFPTSPELNKRIEELKNE